MQSTEQRFLFAAACLFGLWLWAVFTFPVIVSVRNGHNWTVILLFSLIPTLGAVYLFGSGWRLRQRGLERLALGALFLLAVAWRVGGAWQDEAAHAARDMCLRNLSLIGALLQAYAADHHGRLPEADVWVDALAPYVDGPERLKCPSDRTEARCSYGMNSALSGVDIDAIQEPESVVLVYETVSPGDNPTGGPEDVVDRHRLVGGDYFVCVDGHSHWFPREKLPDGTYSKEPAPNAIWEPVVGVLD